MFHVKQTGFLKQNVSRKTDFEGTQNPGADDILHTLFHVKHKTTRADQTTFTPSRLFHVKQFEKQTIQRRHRKHTNKTAFKTTVLFHVKHIQNLKYQNHKRNVSRETKINHRKTKQRKSALEIKYLLNLFSFKLSSQQSQSPTLQSSSTLSSSQLSTHPTGYSSPISPIVSRETFLRHKPSCFT